MTLGIITGFSTKNSAGLEEFLFGLLSGFAATRPSDVRYRIYTSASNDLARVLIERGIRGFEIVPLGFGRWWKQLALPFAPRSDVYLWNGPIISPLFFPRRSAVLIYDFAYRQYEDRSLKARTTDWLTALALRRADQIISISHATAEDAVRLFGVSRTKITVAYPGAKDFSQVKEVSIETPADGYFLFVGTAKKRKNLLNLVLGYIQAAKEGVPEHLLIAGRNDPSSAYGRSINEAIVSSGLGDRITFLGLVEDGTLAYLYRHALALAFPSAFEGFGMPVVEAQRLGLPVLTSTASSLPEVAGDAALLVAPDDSMGIAAGLLRLSTDAALREQLSMRGKENAKRFSWEGCARDILRVVSGA